MRNKYWSCSKFADWIRGTAKGGAKTSEDWNKWRDQAMAFSPIRYWLAEELLDQLQGIVHFVPDKLYDVKYYINNRFVTKTHSLTASRRRIKPGDWCDLGNRFLPCMFDELQNFVEIEMAWWQIAWSDDTKKYNQPFWARGWFRWRTWRCPEAGLDCLAWQCKLTQDDGVTPTPQELEAQEILDLYTWWTQVYANRPDPDEASGWTELYWKNTAPGRGVLDTFASCNDTALSEAIDRAHEIEEAYETEDEQMLIRLVKIRKSLWT